jgi:hypothetical protein
LHTECRGLTSLKKHCGLCHLEGILVDNGVAAYCNKDKGRLEGPWEFGIKPKNGRRKIETC